MKYLKKSMALILLLSLMVFAAACGNEKESSEDTNKDSSGAKKVTIMLDWTPNTNHTGIYVAKNQGYYKDLGYDVEIVQPSQGTTEQLVASGQADFGVSYQESLTQARIANVPIVSIAAIIQHNTSALASPVNNYVVSPTDFADKKYGSYGSAIEESIVQSIMEKHEVDPSTLEIVNIGEADFFTATESQVDFSWIFYAWTGIEAELRDVDLNLIWVRDEDPENLDYYTPIFITTENKITYDPQQVKDILAATAQGYKLAIEDPELAAQIMTEEVPELDAELVKNSQIWLAEQYQADAEQWGWQDEKVWTNFTKWLLDRNLIEADMDVTKAFTNDFLPE